MGYPIQSNAPQITIGGSTYAFGVSASDTAMGRMCLLGLFVQSGSEWNASDDPESTLNSGQLLADVQKSGGINPFITQLVASVNSWLTSQGINTQFKTSAVSAPEPTTDDECLLAAISVINAGRFTKQPIPVQMAADIASYWASPFNSVPIQMAPTLQICRLGDRLAIYADDNGQFVTMTPNSDPNAQAKQLPSLAACWKAAYGFVPQ